MDLFEFKLSKMIQELKKDFDSSISNIKNEVYFSI